jgi:hypothetical protein
MKNLFTSKWSLALTTAAFLLVSLPACDSSDADPFDTDNGDNGSTSGYDGICLDADSNIWSYVIGYGWPTEDGCNGTYLDVDPQDYTEKGAFFGSCDDRDGKVWFYYENSDGTSGDAASLQAMCESNNDIWTPAP